MESKALWHLSKEQSVILETPFRPPKEGYCEIKTLYSLVSIGTERLVAKGVIPQELHREMGVPYMEGSFDFPVKYGYSLVGKVISSDDKWNDKLVHLLHPHQSRCQVAKASLSLVPDGIPAPRACLASNLETALTAVWDAELSIGDRVAVLGFGPIGALLCRLLNGIPAIELHVFEKSPARAKLARSFGFKVSDPQQIRQKFDVSFNVSSSAEGLQLCLDHTGKEGRVVELSWYGEQSVQLELGKYFHSQRLKLISSQVGQIPSTRTARWDYQRRKQTVFKLLQNPDFDLHLTHIMPFESAPGLFRDLRKGPIEGIGYCLSY